MCPQLIRRPLRSSGCPPRPIRRPIRLSESIRRFSGCQESFGIHRAFLRASMFLTHRCTRCLAEHWFQQRPKHLHPDILFLSFPRESCSGPDPVNQNCAKIPSIAMQDSTEARVCHHLDCKVSAVIIQPVWSPKPDKGVSDSLRPLEPPPSQIEIVSADRNEIVIAKRPYPNRIDLSY